MDEQGKKPGDQSRRRPARAQAEKQDWIGEHLRAAYRQVMAEPLPDELVELLRQIESPKDRSTG